MGLPSRKVQCYIARDLVRQQHVGACRARVRERVHMRVCMHACVRACVRAFFH